ncbi:MAG: hypothetical protein HYR94_17935 [Chloroflexi bacterium]|nr:hypothetical protein [Chloroflexota bacterium]
MKKLQLNTHQLFLTIICLLTLAFLASTPPVQAAGFTVDNNGDAGDANPGDGTCATAGAVCTLRAAVEEANALGGADTITIPAMTIILGAQLTVIESVSISGAGQASTIIDGNNAVRGFFFRQSSGTHALSDLTIRNARVNRSTDPEPPPAPIAHGGNGGAIFNRATLALTNVTVTNNQAEQGAGIFNMLTAGADIPTLSLDSVTITNNLGISTSLGDGGGGLYNGGALTGSNVTIIGNTSATQGGGYYNNSSQAVSLTNFTLNNNSAYNGGGINNDFDPAGVTLTNGTISNNVTVCSGPPATGGSGIYNNDGIMTLTDVTISGNTNTCPGGFGGGFFNLAIMTLSRVTISGNSATYGAGIANGGDFGSTDVVKTNDLTVVNSTISGNIGVTLDVRGARGGGIYNRTISGAAAVNGLKLTNATLTNNSAIFGGGIYDLPDNNPVILKNTILAGNTATSTFPGQPKGPDCGGSTDPIGTIISNGHNILGSTEGCSFAATGTDQLNVNPLLAALQDNGGATLTHGLQPGSPAIDRGDNGSCPATDQRNFSRPIDGDANGNAVCDVGAYETAKQILTSLNPTGVKFGSPTFTLTVKGINFTNDMIVRWNGADRNTTFVDSATLTISVNAADVATTALVTITVFDRAPGGGLSNPLKFIVFDSQLFLPVLLK